MHCCPSAHLHWLLKSVNQYDCLSWHKACNKMNCCSATFHGFVFTSLSLSISRGGRYCKQLLICVLLANDDPVNSQKACVVFMMNQIFVFWPVLTNMCRRRDLGTLFVPFYEFCHIHNVWLRLVPVHRFCRRRGQIESRETDHDANKTYLYLSVPPLLSL